jgi:ribosome-associated heat shock protein Hsp15
MMASSDESTIAASSDAESRPLASASSNWPVAERLLMDNVTTPAGLTPKLAVAAWGLGGDLRAEVNARLCNDVTPRDEKAGRALLKDAYDPRADRRRDDSEMEATRVDRYLWAVRFYKTRTAATTACNGGHVRINDAAAKPASPVRIGDRIAVALNGRERIIEVVQIADRRGSATVAAACIIDHSPPPPEREFAAPAFVRDAATGRPTKKDRRDLDRIRRT